MTTSFRPFHHAGRAGFAAALVLLASACSTPAPVAKTARQAAPRAPAVAPSAMLSAMIKNMQVPSDQVSYFDQAGKAMTPDAFTNAIDSLRAKYTVKASRNFSEGAWAAAAEVHLLEQPAVAQQTP